MDAKLVVVGGDAKATEVKLRLPMIIGRGRGAGITIPHPLVSRQHCEIVENEGGLFVRDMGAKNGRFVGDRAVRQEDGWVALPPGTLLTIGTVTFRAVYGEGPDLSPPSPPLAGQDDETIRQPVAADTSAGEEEVMDISFEEVVDEVLEEEAEGGEIAPPQPPGVPQPAASQPAAEQPAAQQPAASDTDLLDVEDIEIEEVEEVEEEAASPEPAKGSPAVGPPAKGAPAKGGPPPSDSAKGGDSANGSDADSSSDDDALNSFFRGLQ